MSTEPSPAIASTSPGRPPALPFLKPGWMKKAINLSNGVKKFVQYNRDLMTPAKLEHVKALHARFDLALRHRNKDETTALETELIKSCEGAVPHYKSSPVKENIEVIVVAIVVALGIRAYFLQPFKIPTASMQPTLNGITARAMPETEAFPNAVVQGIEYIVKGRNYVEMRVPQDWGSVRLVGIRQRTRAKFFTISDLVFMDGGNQERVLTGYVPTRQMWEDLWVGPKPQINRDNYVTLTSGVETLAVAVPAGPVVPAGTLMVRGFIDTGDQVLVNKMAYHFRRPTRGEVFVFSTAGITGITPPAGVDSQHYIKRLTALPWDELKLTQTETIVTSPSGQQANAILNINGTRAVEAGPNRVMSLQNGYQGYTMVNSPFVQGEQPLMLGSKQYMAMGDNSANSFDSRMWGPVPEENLVGPALFVYWPFLPHFGLIR